MFFPEAKDLKIKPGDIILLAFLILISIFISLYLFNKHLSTPDTVEVHHSGKLIFSFPLNKPGNYTITYNNAEVEINISEERTVKMVNSNCPLKLCTKSREISKPGENIVCLPNKIIISIKGKKDLRNVDSTSY
ncbi:MAG: NusG domain II-containing protein [bacterium]|nr:NusG domain II-containing protein [bacterium]